MIIFFQVELAHQRKRRKEKCVFFVTCLSPVCLFCESNFWSLIDDAREILKIRPMQNYINVLTWFNSFLDNDDNDGDNQHIDLHHSPL